MKIAEYTNTALTATGNGSVIDLGQTGNHVGSGEITVTSIGTSVAVRYDYSSKKDFSSDVVKGTSLTISANETRVMSVHPIRQYCRPVLETITGGTPSVVFTTKIFE